MYWQSTAALGRYLASRKDLVFSSNFIYFIHTRIFDTDTKYSLSQRTNPANTGWVHSVWKHPKSFAKRGSQHTRPNNFENSRPETRSKSAQATNHHDHLFRIRQYESYARRKHVSLWPTQKVAGKNYSTEHRSASLFSLTH